MANDSFSFKDGDSFRSSRPKTGLFEFESRKPRVLAEGIEFAGGGG